MREHDVPTMAAPAGMTTWVIAGFAVRGVPRASVTLMLMTWLVIAGTHAIAAQSPRESPQAQSNTTEPMARMRIPRFWQAAGRVATRGLGNAGEDPHASEGGLRFQVKANRPSGKPGSPVARNLRTRRCPDRSLQALAPPS